jgi:branched-chain amino acid transport system substrate-binding protein
VCTTDDVQGAAAAQFAKSIGVKSVYVLNDNQTYGQGVAQAFTTEANKIGIKVLSSGAYGEAWDAKQTSYAALFTKIKSLHPDMVYIGGIFDNNGGQLVKDKFKVLGDNTKVKIMAPDGFTGYPDFVKMPEADGAYLSFAGLSADLITAASPAAAKFVADYTAKYGKAPVGSYPIYGVAAVQIIMAAIAASDGTRKGVHDAIFSGAGLTISAADSVLGKETTLDPATGDVNAKDITIELVKGGAETTLKAWPVA